MTTIIVATIVGMALAAAAVGLCKVFGAQATLTTFVMHHAGRTA